MIKKAVPSLKRGGEDKMVEREHLVFMSDDEESDEEMYEDVPTMKPADSESTQAAPNDEESGSEEEEEGESDMESENSDSDESDADPPSQDDEESDVEDSGRLFVRNLSYTVTEEDLNELFSAFGELAEIHIPLDKETRKCKG